MPLYIIPDNVIYDPRLLCQFIAKHRITRMLFTPSLLEAVLDAERERVTTLMTSLRWCNSAACVQVLMLLDVMQRYLQSRNENFRIL